MHNIFLDYNRRNSFGDWEIVYHLSGAIVSLAPKFKPRKLQEIIDKFICAFRYSKDIKQIISSFYITCSYNELHDFLKNILMSIPEFQELNLSNKEYENGISVNDPERKSIVLISRYSAELDADDDFIDLDACIQNIVNGLYRVKEIFGD